ncbi:MAG TPA: metallophosphoesterase, partial [Kofleriaceae bacterium]|nr:metallophosphoesterase [Kofleriaceae bacterium]
MIALALAAAAQPAEAGSSRFRKGPYLQNVSATSATLMWESDERAPAVVEVGGTPARRIQVAADDIQEVVVDDLQPGKRYPYTVTIGDQTVRGEFATAPPPGAPFSFVVFGDSRDSAGSHQRVVARVREEVVDFVLGTGDIVSEGHREQEWQTFFDIERELLKHTVLYPSLGNHDRQGRGRTADNYRKYFSLPENSPDPERYYAFTYGSARFLILDSNSNSFALTDQTAWIEEQLQSARLDPNIRHVFVSMHHPPFSVSLHGGQAELREAWTPLYEKWQVAAVFSGHDHVYSRAERSGVRYFVSGGGGAPLYPRKARSSRIDVQATQYFERVNHYLKVHVYGDLIEVTAIRADGTIIETTSWGTPPAPGAPLVARAGAGSPARPGGRPAAVAAAAPTEPAGRSFGLFG